MRFSFLILAALLLTPPALAQQEEAPEKKTEVPFRQDAGLITAEYYLATGKYTQALDVLGGVLQRHADSADAYAYRGYAYGKLGDSRKARENYQKAVVLDPSHLGANKYLANLYLDAGEIDRAMEQMQAIRLICADTGCAELDELQADINRFSKERKEKSAE